MTLSPQIIISLILIASVIILSRFPRLKLIVLILSIIITARYILWRGIYTLNTQDWIGVCISLTVYLAEIYGFIQQLLFHYQSVKPTNHVSPAIKDPDLPTVDIFIPIYNEPKEILYRTIIGCMAQDYPKEKFKVYVLDDGKRDEIKELARKLGCIYLSRPINEHAKAGNLNNALKYSEGDMVAVFDCDHVPVRSFLRETIGFFADPKVAFVQTPHHFYNPDTFQKNLKLEKEISNEQDLFFHIIQPGRDYYNSAFFAGSSGIFRQSCLKEIGGFKIETLTEDLHTSMELHSRGYKSIYVNQDLSAGLSPESYASYLKQRKRWARGGIQVFILDNPLVKRGLTPHQRLNYFASIIYFFHGLPRIIYLAAPLAYLLFGYPPLLADTTTLLNLFLSHYIASTIAFNTVSKGHRNPFWSDVYETVMSFGITATAFTTFLNPKDHSFAVTPKNERFDKISLKTSIVIPHLILTGLLLAGIVSGLFNILKSTGNYGASLISLSWASYNVLILIASIIAARERPQRRGLIRLARNIETRLMFQDREIKCRTRDISETGLSIIVSEPIKFPNPTINLSLISDYGESTNLKGMVVRNDIDKNNRIFAGIHFIDINDSGYQAIIRQMYSPSNSWSGYHNIQPKLWSSFILLFTASVKAFVKDKVLRRISPRFGIKLPCEIKIGNAVLKGKTIDISSTGLSLEAPSDNYLPPEIYALVYLRENNYVSLKSKVIWQVMGRKGSKFGIKFLNTEEGNTLWKELKGLS